MIRAMIFDLDGTLVQTERLKALSYARAAVELCPSDVSEVDVVEAFKQVVGLSRREVASALMQQFGLAERAQARIGEFGVSVAWQAYVQVRLRHYEEMLADPQVLRNNQWPHNIALLDQARKTGCKVGLATMSHCAQVRRVLEILGLTDAFDFVASRNDVENGKPDPEIYLLVSVELDVPPQGCLVIEDSVSGVKAALDAGMWCVAVTTPFTREALHSGGLLEERWVIDDPNELPGRVDELMAERARMDDERN